MNYKAEAGWVIDENNNRAGIEYWGSEEKATDSLKTLTDCFRCSGCSGCSGCFRKKEELKVPVIEDIHKKLFEAVVAPKALDMSQWHTCDTTHCRAGWIVTLAGEAGRELEKETSTLFAAMQIYKKSGYEISPVRFFDSDKKAMADMKRLAEIQ